MLFRSFLQALHGLLRPEAIDALRGSKHIIHAGDIGASEVLDELAAIAPVTAIRGNIDKSAWARRLPETELVELAGISIYVLHNMAQLDLKPEAAGVRVVIYGHSHAWITIVDTHVTTIVSAAILFIFGTGPVKGFATTLTFGLLANLFTAVFVSRVIFDWVLSRKQRGEALSI